ncbi:protein kinase, partial [Streptomyces sp. DvalAA-19]|uniref:protein kinase domain-containing protein n=1 Tax=Streptomyces sp. DvalAA-19 TaxID=1839761 RepID=UPI00081AF18E
MEALRSEDPRRFGRFSVLARFQETASAVRYVARDTGIGETAVITAARPALAAVPAFRRRFEAEARTAERLAGGWVAPPLETGDGEVEGAELLWTAAGYVPALPLADAIGIAGPLPERALRILGAGIAEILSRVHAGGSVLQGLAPDTVLLAGDGPRLTAFGPLGAAATAEARPGGQLSVRLGYLTPEQVAGKEAGAPSDLFVLGLLLAYAATGTTPFTEGPPEEAARRIAEADPELDAVPEELRTLIAGCLAKDPAERPTAGTVAAELALEGAAGLARGGWLPERLAAAVAEQEARVRALEGAWEAPAAADSVPEVADAVTEVADSVPGAADAVPEVADSVPGAADAVPAVADAVHGDAVPGDAVPQEGGAVGTQAPADPRVPLAPDATANATHDTGAIGEDRGTTRFLDTGPKPPHSDRATTQLTLPHQPPPLPAIPAHQHTHGSPAPYPAAVLPGSAGPGSGQGINGRSSSGQGANGQGGSGGPMVALPLPPAPAPPSGGPALDRRGLLTVAAAAVGGLVVGGGAVAVIGGGESAVATDAKPAAPKPRRTLPGQPP